MNAQKAHQHTEIGLKPPEMSSHNIIFFLSLF